MSKQTILMLQVIILRMKKKYIMYYDTNNLHGCAMNQPLPYSGFKWLTKNDKNNCKFNRKTRKGWILEVELEYPKELHKLHNDYSLAPEKLAVKNGFQTTKQNC